MEKNKYQLLDKEIRSLEDKLNAANDSIENFGFQIYFKNNKQFEKALARLKLLKQIYSDMIVADMFRSLTHKVVDKQSNVTTYVVYPISNNKDYYHIINDWYIGRK